ncbi:hypothetical protein CRG98_030878 [Punica granatum]|uniref:Uncharacterized protein n=1 Tax=Punica granatum TaxID=22663 RepID=A0A2I0IXK2_PUNGR|nr:hypothetical protein CRG98_030878 [Punica granatum]
MEDYKWSKGASCSSRDNVLPSRNAQRHRMLPVLSLVTVCQHDCGQGPDDGCSQHCPELFDGYYHWLWSPRLDDCRRRHPKDIPKPFLKYPIYYIALHRYTYQGFCKNEFKGLEFEVRLNGGQQMVGGKQVLRDYFQIDKSYSKWVDLCILLG